MKTLVASPFEDDVADYLAYFYGNKAKYFFLRCLEGQRLGQAFMNALSMFDTVSYHRLAQSLVNPFYEDHLMREAVDLWTSK